MATTQHLSTLFDSLNKVAKRLDFSLDFLSSKTFSEKLSRLARAKATQKKHQFIIALQGTKTFKLNTN